MSTTLTKNPRARRRSAQLAVLLVGTASCSSGGLPSGEDPPAAVDLAVMPSTDLASPNADLATVRDLALAAVKPIVLSMGASVGISRNARCLLAADLTGDKRPELIVGTSSDNAVSIYKNDGRGGFTTGTKQVVGDYPIALAAADIDKDGRTDLAAASFIGHSFTVLFGNGTGGVSSTQALTSSRYPNDVQLADVDGDGKIDVLGIELGMGNAGMTWSLFPGQGGTRFGTPLLIPAGKGPAGAAVGDLNGDGRNDVVTSGYEGSTYSVHLGQSGGTLQAPLTQPATNHPRLIALADFNRDGKLDFATTFELAIPGHVGVFLGNGNGTFATAVAYAAGNDPYGIGTWDGNGDGIPDLYVASINSGSVSVLTGRGDGSFEQAKDYVIGGGCYNATAGDFDGDGRTDLAAIGGDQVRILHNDTL